MELNIRKCRKGYWKKVNSLFSTRLSISLGFTKLSYYKWNSWMAKVIKIFMELKGTITITIIRLRNVLIADSNIFYSLERSVSYMDMCV